MNKQAQALTKAIKDLERIAGTMSATDFGTHHQLTDVLEVLRKGLEPDPLTITQAAREALSYIICTATEGGHYTKEDFRRWEKYVHRDEEGGRFYAEVTVIPNDDVEGIPLDPIRMTPEELGKRLHHALEHGKVVPKHRSIILRLLDGDEDIAGECDVIDAGVMMQLAVYGEVVYG